MKLSFLPATLMCLLLSVALNCSNGGVTDPTDPDVLIYESFEKNGRPSLSGWFPDDTTTYIRFSQDVPPDGGNWSLAIRAGWAPEVVSVSRKVSLLLGANRYQFSFWAKSEGVPVCGFYAFKKADQFYSYMSCLSPADTTWSVYTIPFGSCCADSTDSVTVGLSGGSTELEAGVIYFDLVKLEKLD